MSTTVLLADDQPVVRAGLRQWFAGSSIEVVGEAEDGSQAFHLTQELRPQVLLMEIVLPRLDGLQCLTKLREEGVAVATLIYTHQSNPTYAARASALGAAGFASKTMDQTTLSAAVQTVATGGNAWPATMTRRLTGSIAADAGVAPTPLTGREAEVLKQLAFGLSNKEIAQALGISYETVKEHVQHVLRKLHVADRTQAAVWAVRQGLA